MKLLLFIGKSSFIESFGGAEKVVCEMANAFTRRGWSVSIVCNDLKSGRPAYPLLPEVKLININGTGRRLVPNRLRIAREITRPLRSLGFSYFSDRVKDARFRLFADRLDRVVAEIAPDVILSSFIDDLRALAMCPNAAKTQTVQMLHDPPKKALGPPSVAVRKALGGTAYVQVLLRSFEQDVRKYCDTETVTIPNAVPQYAGQISYEKKDTYRIVNVARLDANQKRQHILIDAFALLANEVPDWTLHFYGPEQGWRYPRKLRKQILQHGLEKRVFLEGATSRIEETLLTADLFAFPSAWEGFGLALLEAMRVGLPSVGFQSAPAVNELIQDGKNGLLAEDGAAGMAAALRRLMGNAELRRRLGENARAFAAEFAPEKIWDQWETLLVRVISQNQADQRKTSKSRV